MFNMRLKWSKLTGPELMFIVNIPFDHSNIRLLLNFFIVSLFVFSFIEAFTIKVQICLIHQIPSSFVWLLVCNLFALLLSAVSLIIIVFDHLSSSWSRTPKQWWLWRAIKITFQLLTSAWQHRFAGKGAKKMMWASVIPVVGQLCCFLGQNCCEMNCFHSIYGWLSS